MAARILKVTLGDDTRRLSFQSDDKAAAVDVLHAINTAIQRGFELPAAAANQLALKYIDDEEDRCTLTSVTLADLFALYPTGVLRLYAELQEGAGDEVAADVHMQSNVAAAAEDVDMQPNATAAAVVADSEDEQKAAADVDMSPTSGDAPSAPAAPASAADDAQTGDDHEAPEFQPEVEMFLRFALPFLPMAAAIANAKRQELNRMCVEKREDLLPLCRCLEQHLGQVPEAEVLRPALLRFLSGEDKDSFGDFVTDLLQIWTSTSSPEGVEACLRAIFKELKKIKEREAGGNGDQQPTPAPWQHVLNGLMAAKGKGKGNWPFPQAAGAPASSGMPGGHDGSIPNHLGNLGNLLGGLLAAKGKGKGMAAAGAPWADEATRGAAGAPGAPGAAGAAGAGYSTPTPHQPLNLLGGILGGLLQGKGGGKGGIPAGFHPDIVAASAPAAEEPVAPTSTAGEPPPPLPAPCETAPAKTIVEQNVQDLLDMGLVSDADAARAALAACGDDLAAAVAMLCGED